MFGNDDYTTRARVAPALIAVTPPVVLAVASIPFVPADVKAIPIVVAVFSVIAGQLGRDAGETRERALLDSWGGPPTTTMLRPHQTGTASLSNAMLARRHRQLETLWGSGLAFPTVEQQHADLAATDSTIADFVTVLRARTRDAGAFPLVAAENINYGFRRNCFGLRRAAVALAVLTLIASAGIGAVLEVTRSDHVGVVFAIPAAFAVLALAFWRRVSNVWVHKAARRYARSLLESLDVLPEASPAAVARDV